MEGPRPIEGDIEAILQRVLPDDVAQARVGLLREHVEAVLTLRNHVREVYDRRFIETAGALIDEGWSNSSAYDLAAMQLEDERKVLEQELEEQLDNLKNRLRVNLQRLVGDNPHYPYRRK